MNKINSMRAKLLFEKFYDDSWSSKVETTFVGMIERILTIPSYSVIQCCPKSVKNVPFIRLNKEVFKDDLANMECAIKSTFVEFSNCTRCKKKPQFKREFTNHVFVEVRHKSNQYFIQIRLF